MGCDGTEIEEVNVQHLVKKRRVTQVLRQKKHFVNHTRFLQVHALLKKDDIRKELCEGQDC